MRHRRPRSNGDGGELRLAAELNPTVHHLYFVRTRQGLMVSRKSPKAPFVLSEEHSSIPEIAGCSQVYQNRTCGPESLGQGGRPTCTDSRILYTVYPTTLFMSTSPYLTNCCRKRTTWTSSRPEESQAFEPFIGSPRPCDTVVHTIHCVIFVDRGRA